MTSLPRGNCSVCGREVAVRRNGTAREHAGYGKPQPVVCSGAGKLIVEAWPALAGRGGGERQFAMCIGCHCDDLHACMRELSLEEIIERDVQGALLVLPAHVVAAQEVDRCHWLRVDYAVGLGVCSECPGFVEAFDHASALWKERVEAGNSGDPAGKR